jgi:aconitate hydratase
VRAVVAKSFARIHRSNLVAQGIPPLSFADEADCDRAEQGQEWTIPDVGAAVRAGATVLEAQTPFGPVRLEARLTAREREILLAGGLVAYAKAG